MIADKRVLCIIPVRGGSKGLPGKNARLLAGRPLVSYTFDHAKACPEIDRIVVSTDDDELARLAREAGIDVPFLRPAALAGDDVGTVDVLLHAMEAVRTEEGVPYDIVVLLHATAPLRTPEDVRACLRLVAEEGAENAFSVCESQRNPYFNMVEVDGAGHVSLCKEGPFIARQEAPRVYELNSAVYVWPWHVLACNRAVVLPGSRLHFMPKERSVDVDDAMDFLIAECLLRASAG